MNKEIEKLNGQYQELGERLDQIQVPAGVDELKANVDCLSEGLSKKAETAAFENQQLQLQLQGFNDAVQRKVGEIEERLHALDKVVDAKLEVLSETAKRVQRLHDTIMETVVCSRHSAELERLRMQLQTLGSAPGPKARLDNATTPTRRRSMWSRICGCERRYQENLKSALNADTFLLLEQAGKSLSSSTGPPCGTEEKLCSDDSQREMSPQDILAAVLATEQRCLTSGVDVADGLVVERLVDEPTLVYCTCSSLESQTIISCLWAQYEDVTLDAAKHALLSEEERASWDADSEFKICQKADNEDEMRSEVVHHVLHAPWPFWDRDVLQQRWQLPLGNGSGQEGTAIVMRSVSDDKLVSEHAGRVRAKVSKAAFLLRPANGGRGLQLTTCSQIDIGGLVPQWAQNFLTRLAVQRAEAWKEKLREHCLSMASRAG